jgi:hypothetical protein
MQNRLERPAVKEASQNLYRLAALLRSSRGAITPEAMLRNKETMVSIDTLVS